MQLNKFKIIFTSSLVLSFFTPYSFAYLGPGMSATFIATIIGIFGSIFLLIFAVIYYPIKRLLKKNNNKRDT